MKTLYQILDGMRACNVAKRWARGYGTDYERAWNECTNGYWMEWLICSTSFIPDEFDDNNKFVKALKAADETADEAIRKEDQKELSVIRAEAIRKHVSYADVAAVLGLPVNQPAVEIKGP